MESVRMSPEGVALLKDRLGLDLRLHRHNDVASRDGIRRFSFAVGDANPLWTDAGYAARTRYGGLVAPPCFLYSVVCPTGDLAGSLPGIHSFHGGNDWQFHRTIHAGDTITARAKLTNVVEKKSSYAGTSVIQYVAAVYRNQREELLAKAAGWSIRAERAAGRERAKYADMTAYSYTADEIRNIEDTCVNEAPRGDKPRYWEETRTGQELAPVVKGPLTFEDVESFIAATHGSLGYRAFVDYVKRHPAWVYTDQENGLPTPVSRVNLYDEVAQLVGIPRAYALGCQRVSWLGHMMTNWMGDDGVLKALSAQLRIPALLGDTQWCRGKVEGKSVAGEAHLVTCEIWAENQRGQKTAWGKAIVDLPSRTGDRQVEL